ncbi:hypothetical protein [Novosphingobium sp. ZW T3_23]|uniref:hypothetical protein n=1 Tax=Novosphingobium sp. ZW T3_23 TaxID=3378084 RepID=UPI0038541BB8
MVAQKIPILEAREVEELLKEALTLLDSRGQMIIGAHVQMALNLLQESMDVDEIVDGSEHHAR